MRNTAISQESIIQASLLILSREGADGLTMRRLADELGIKAASLYWHVKDKRALYGLIAENACVGIAPMLDGAAPDNALRRILRLFRGALLKTRDLVAVFSESEPSTKRRMELIRLVNENVLKLGVEERNLITAANLLNNYVLSFVADEMRFPKDSRVEADEQFEYGMQVIIVGLSAQSDH